MKKNKLLIALLAFCLVISCFAGCAKDPEPSNAVVDVTETQAAPSSPSNTAQTEATGEAGTENEVPEESKPSENQGTIQSGNNLMLEQIGVVDADRFNAYTGGLTYTDSDTKKYGIISPNGAVDSGAVYVVVAVDGAYFTVMSKKAANENDLAGLNTFALVDGNGRQIVGPQYAAYDVMGDFVVAYKATGKNEKGQVYFIKGSDAFETPNTETVHYQCTWDVYSVVTGTKLLEGSGNFSGYTYGCWLRYNDGNDHAYMDTYGNTLPKGAKVFDDGSYACVGQVGEVFSPDGTRLFAYDVNGYVPKSTDGVHYIASRYMDGKSTYVLMDKAGKIISAEFESITLKGNFILCDSVLYDFQGNVVQEGTCKSVYRDAMFGNYYIARFDDAYTLMDETGAVILQGSGENEVAYTEEFVFSDKSSGERMFYCHKTNSYDIKGTSVSPWFVRIDDANYTYKLVDTITGSTLLSGYLNYTYVKRDDTTYYLYAKYNGGAIAYLVTSTDGFRTVTDKKNNLIDDLAGAFQAEGIQATVNRSTGEILMDSSVLFGGDSSELTAEGKVFLNQFIKVYNSVAFSAEYEGFISRTMIEGHTAPVAGSTYAGDLPLSQERAANVKAYILSGETGVDMSKNADAFVAIGYSNSQPVYKNDGTVDMDASRRVSFRFLVDVDGLS